MHVVAAQLGGCFAHDHARHERHSRHVAADPELIGCDILVARKYRFQIVVDDCRKLLHFEALRVVATDSLAVDQDAVQVISRRVEDQVLLGHVGGWVMEDLGMRVRMQRYRLA